MNASQTETINNLKLTDAPHETFKQCETILRRVNAAMHAPTTERNSVVEAMAMLVALQIDLGRMAQKVMECNIPPARMAAGFATKEEAEEAHVGSIISAAGSIVTALVALVQVMQPANDQAITLEQAVSHCTKSLLDDLDEMRKTISPIAPIMATQAPDATNTVH